ncbi:MAG: alpha-glucosidase C-terminal domain-containing protein, partial [Bacillota bacterium]
YSPAKPQEIHWRRMMQAIVFQMTFVGAPMIYYGDEAGMWGPDDPSNRQPMIWQDLQPYDDPEVTFNERLFAHYQRLIAIRRQLPALQLGGLRILAADDARGILAFARDHGDDHAYIVLNRSPKEHHLQLDLGDPDTPDELIDWLASSHVSLACPPSASDESPTSEGRPHLQVHPNARGIAITHGTAHITLPPFASVVLASRWH